MTFINLSFCVFAACIQKDKITVLIVFPALFPFAIMTYSLYVFSQAVKIQGMESRTRLQLRSGRIILFCIMLFLTISIQFVLSIPDKWASSTYNRFLITARVAACYILFPFLLYLLYNFPIETEKQNADFYCSILQQKVSMIVLM